MDGALRLTDSETGERVDLMADRGAMDDYKEALDAFLKDIREHCASREVPYILLDGEQNFEEIFIPLLSQGKMI